MAARPGRAADRPCDLEISIVQGAGRARIGLCGARRLFVPLCSGPQPGELSGRFRARHGDDIAKRRPGDQNRDGQCPAARLAQRALCGRQRLFAATRRLGGEAPGREHSCRRDAEHQQPSPRFFGPAVTRVEYPIEQLADRQTLFARRRYARPAPEAGGEYAARHLFGSECGCENQPAVRNVSIAALTAFGASHGTKWPQSGT